MQQEHDSQVQKLREALRWKEQEAILLRHQLSRTSHQPSGNTVSLSNAPVVTPPTTINKAPLCSTSPLLAAHLLQTCPEEPPSLLIAAANNPSSSENILLLVWLLSEHWLLNNTGWIWLKEALTWSATVRRLVWGSCRPRTSRVSCQHKLKLNWNWKCSV
jgi:hypothetical protein